MKKKKIEYHSWEMIGKNFVNLHTHSFYSILEASCSPEKILEKAKKLGHSAVSLTDSGVGYGLLEFYKAAKKKGIKPILGAEIFVAKDSRFEHRAGIDGREGYLVCLAKNIKGWENLLQILSFSHLEGFYYKPRADWEILEKYAEGIIVLTGGETGLVGKCFSEFGKTKAIEIFKKCQQVFGKQNVYTELVAREDEEQKKLNRFKLEISRICQAPIVATSEARYLDISEEEAAETLYCIGKNQIIHDSGRSRIMQKSWFKSWEEIEKDLDFVPDEILENARLNTLKIADEIDLAVSLGQNLLPHFEVEIGEDEASQLKKNCEKGWKQRFGVFENSAEFDATLYQDRLNYELTIIEKMGFSAYFLIVEDFIKFAKKNKIAVGPGRGSAAGSLVSYLLEITNIDPIKYELLFERFLNPERVSMPDIDIDFSDERREEVLQYVIEKYGAEKVSKVCTFGTLAAKAALKDVGRAQGVPFSEMNELTKLLPSTPGFELKEAEKFPDFKKLLSESPHLKKVFEVARKLEGCVRHVSVHACAVMIAPDALAKFCPIQWAPGTEKIKITQFPYEQLESIGLLKMDFLGLRNLSILEKTIQNIENSTGEKINLDTIPENDTHTFTTVFANGETTGVFQFESSGMRRYLKELKPTEFEDLVAMNALYRPGPMEYIPQYIKGKHNRETVVYLDKSLEPILKKTYGIAVYQEQVLRIARDFAGFSLGEADLLRKAIGKKIVYILEEQREKFINGAVENGFLKELAIKIFDEIIVPFSGYGFNRSHAVCYARIAYETAYLRANYPVEFMAAMMTTDRNNTDRIVLEMSECTSMGIEVLPPSINESGSHFTVIKENTDQLKINDPEVSLLPTKKLRFGLTAIKGLGEETVELIILERQKNSKFSSLQDFAKRVPSKIMNKKTLEALAFSGSFDAFGDRKAIVDSLDDLTSFAKDHQLKKESGQMGLFGGIDESAIEFTLKNTRATKEDILRWERESLGLFVSDHPLKGLGAYFEKYGHLIGHLNVLEDKGQTRTLHGMVSKVRKILTKKGKNMAVFELEDTSGKIECAVFPQVYETININNLSEDAFLRVRGKIEDRDGVLNCLVEEITFGNIREVQNATEMFVPPPSKKLETLDVFEIIIPNAATKSQINVLKSLLTESKDPVGRRVKIVIQEKEIEISFRVKVDTLLERKIEKIWGMNNE